MKRIAPKASLLLFLNLFLASLFLLGCNENESRPELEAILETGDIIFQNANSAQCRAIEEATNSEWTHVGIIDKTDQGCFVIEAVQPVKRTRLSQFLARDNGKCVVKRYSVGELSKTDIVHYSSEYLGKDYDALFSWEDDEIYCSELVWKAYNRAGVQLCELRELRDYSLESDLVRHVMISRYGDDAPLREKMVAPNDIFSSTLLKTIYLN